jgi:putative effector of murein hydrolase
MSSETLGLLCLTLLAWGVANLFYDRMGKPAWCHPLIIAAPLVFLPAWALGVDWPAYRSASSGLSYLLAPGVVALAIPLTQEWPALKTHWRMLCLATLLGAAFAAASAWLLAWSAGAPGDILLSIAPKSVTSAIALGIIDQTGGLAPLTAAVVLVTGIVGALAGPPLFRWMGIDDPRVIGFTLGLVAHIVGTARAASYGRQAAAYAGLGMGLTGIVTAIFLPLLLGQASA